MKRSTIAAVALTALVLLVAGNVARLPHGADALAALERAAHATLAWSRHALASPPRFPRVTLPHLRVPKLAMPSFTRTAIARADAPVSRRFTSFAPPTLLVSSSPAGTRGLSPLVAIAIAAVLALAAAGLALALWLARRGDPRSRVFAMARRGHDAARIARRARVPQDAVRTLLTPGVGARR